MSVIRDTSNAVRDAIMSATVIPVVKGELTYSANAAQVFELQAQKTNRDAAKTTTGGDPIDYWDIAQSHFFTVQIYSSKTGAGLHDINGKPFNFASGRGTYSNYIPVKSMNFNYTSYDNMNIPFGIFGDFPLLHRKKVTSISFSCYDIDQDAIEKALKFWEQQCFPQGKYVAYLEDIVAELKYTSYDVKGRPNFTRVLDVIPAQSVSVSRSYEENAAKLLNFSVVAVGAPGASASSGDGTLKERGYGDGNEHADRIYEMRTSTILNPSSPNSQAFTDSDHDQY